MRDFLQQLDFSVLTDALINVIPAVICITLHELSHGAAALRLGDPTAKNAGRLTLNPLKHIDLFGLICLAVFGFGWAKPVPIDMRNFKNPRRGMAPTARAGPAANIGHFPCRLGVFHPGAVRGKGRQHRARRAPLHGGAEHRPGDIQHSSHTAARRLESRFFRCFGKNLPSADEV